MDFVFDPAQIPIIGSKYWDLQSSSQHLPVSNSASSTTATLSQSVHQSPMNVHSRDSRNLVGEAGSSSTGASSSEGGISTNWKRPLASQVTICCFSWPSELFGCRCFNLTNVVLFKARTRERLVSLLNCYGPRVIPKSPSVSCSEINE